MAWVNGYKSDICHIEIVCLHSFQLIIIAILFFCLYPNNENDSFENQKLMLCNISLILHLTILHVANL